MRTRTTAILATLFCLSCVSLALAQVKTETEPNNARAGR